MKTCHDCGQIRPIWKNYGKVKCCKTCSVKREPKPAKKRTPIKKVSSKRAKEIREYSKQRQEDQQCNFPGCQSRETERHHKAGREGKKLTDLSNQVYLCRMHHDMITVDSGMGVRLGLTVWRNKRA